MAGMTTFGANLALAWLFTTGTAVRPTTWFVAIHTGDPGAEGASSEVVVGDDADYVRQAIAFGTPALKQAKNTGAVTFTPASAATAYDVTHVSIWDASTAGNCICKANIQAIRTIDNSNPLVLAIGDIVEAFS